MKTCPCHGEPKMWHKDARRAAGGYWQCRIAFREACTRHNRSAKGRDRDRRYKATAKGRASQRKQNVQRRVRERTARIQHRKEQIAAWLDT